MANNIVYKTSEMRRRFAAQRWSAVRLSKRIDVSHPTIKKILKTGKGHPDKVYRLAKGLGLPVGRSLEILLPKERRTA